MNAPELSASFQAALENRNPVQIAETKQAFFSGALAMAAHPNQVEPWSMEAIDHASQRVAELMRKKGDRP